MAEALTSLLTSLGSIATAVFGWVGNVATTIVSNPILLIASGFFVVGASIGVFSRMLSKN